MMMILRIMLRLLLGNLVTSLYHDIILHTLLPNTGMCSYCPVSARAFSMKFVLGHVRESTDKTTKDLSWFDQNLTQHPLQYNCRKAVAFVKLIPRVTGRLSKQILLLLLLNDLLYQKQHPHEGTAMSLWQRNHSFIILRSQRPQFCYFLDWILSLLVLIIEIDGVPKIHFVRERIGKLFFLLFRTILQEEQSSILYAMQKEALINVTAYVAHLVSPYQHLHCIWNSLINILGSVFPRGLQLFSGRGSYRGEIARSGAITILGAFMESPLDEHQVSQSVFPSPLFYQWLDYQQKKWNQEVR